MAVALLEPLDALVAERVDEVVHERLARDVADGEIPRVLRRRTVRSPAGGASFRARCPVDEERVVCLRGRFRDRERRGVREAVRRADHEGVERVLLAHLEGGARSRRRGVPRGAGRLDLALDEELDPPLFADLVADRGADQIEEMALDPVARKVVRDRENERSSVSSRLETSPNHVSYVVSLSAPLRRPATSVHRVSAVNSCWRGTTPGGLLGSGAERRA